MSARTQGPWVSVEDILEPNIFRILNERKPGQMDWLIALQFNGEAHMVEQRQAMARIAETPTMYAFIESIACDDDVCTCEANSWLGEGHASACIQGNAIALINKINHEGQS